MDSIEELKKGLKVYNSFEDFVTEAERHGYEFSDVEEAEQLWLHSERNTLLNLPTCGECSHYNTDGFNFFGHCKNKDVGIDETVHQDFGCLNQSSIEQLRKDNDS